MAYNDLKGKHSIDGDFLSVSYHCYHRQSIKRSIQDKAFLKCFGSLFILTLLISVILYLVIRRK